MQPGSLVDWWTSVQEEHIALNTGIILFWNGATPCQTAHWRNQEDHSMNNISSICVCWEHWQLLQLKSYVWLTVFSED